MPILYGDRLIGRIDPLMDRKNGKLVINAVHAEPYAREDRAVGEAIGDSIEQLSEFLDEKQVVYSRRVPRFWKSSLR